MTTKTTQIPDGKGGWIEIEGEAVAGMDADASKQTEALRKQWLNDVDGLIQWFWKQGRLYQSEHGLTEEHVAFAVSLLQVNVRQTYPKGPEAFDQVHRDAWAYYESEVV